MFKKVRINFPNWLKWVLGILSFILLTVISVSIYLYQDIQNSRTAHFNEIEKNVLEDTSLDQVNHIERYHGAQAYYAVYGKASDKSKIVFYPFNLDNNDIKIIDQAKTVPKDSIVTDWKNECSSCKIIDVEPGIIQHEDERQPIWELAYKDEKNQYALAHFSIYDGTKIDIQRYPQISKGE